MSSDSIGSILDDCTINPKAYCSRYDCGQGIYDELADYVPDMCIHLVGRTEAVMRHRYLEKVGGSEDFGIGERVWRKGGMGGEIIGFAVGEDGGHCLVLSTGHADGVRLISLCPVDEAVKVAVPTADEVRKRIVGAIQAAADGTRYESELVAAKADYIMGMAEACFTNKEYPAGGVE